MFLWTRALPQSQHRPVRDTHRRLANGREQFHLVEPAFFLSLRVPRSRVPPCLPANIAALQRVPVERCQTIVADGQPRRSVSDSQMRPSFGKITQVKARIACPIAATTKLPPLALAQPGKPFLARSCSTSIKYSIGNRIKVGSYNCPCSIFSWQEMQCLAQGTASSRFCCISSWQLAH
jgi:hypothetical protein